MLPVCSACGQENPEGARFCNSCGAPLGAEHEAGREERKVVTVLFADLVGFTSRSYRSVGATAYIREAEALFAATV